MERISRTASTILLIGLITGTGYYFRDAWKSFLFASRPCERPIAYSLGEFDERFGIKRADFLKIAAEAEAPWEKAAGKDLFAYETAGTLTINLSYDYRQEATLRLSEIGGSIEEDKATYDALKARYASMREEYDRKNAAYDRRSDAYDKDKEAYDGKVSHWNSQGGAPEEEYETLRQEQGRLRGEAEELNDQARELNALSAEINEAAATLNELAKKLNLKVSAFNTIGASTGEEFNEGEYVRDADGERINVYQFDTAFRLRRLLEHEFGHALGFGHVDDPEAIMYRLNSSSNDSPTAADLEELRSACRIS